jgi:hypothetical protein
MSTKTLRKRIAVVAVSALTAGLVSVVAAPSANAADLVAQDISISSTAGAGTAAALGICAIGSTGLSATVTKTAGLVFTAATGGTGYLKITDGPAYFSAISGNDVTMNTSGSTVTFLATSTSGTATMKFSAEGKVYATVFTSADVAVEAYVVTVAASCAGDTFAPAYSFFRAVTASGEAATTNVDQVGATDVENTSAYIKYALWDAYSAALTTAGALVVTATNNARIGINAAGTTSTAVLATTGGAGYIQVKASADGVATDTVVTATFNGVTVGSKSIKIRGVAKKIVVTDPTIGLSGQSYSATSTAGVGTFTYQWQDAAGNALINGSNNIAASALTGLNTLVTAAGTGTASDADSVPSALTGDDSYGVGTFSCQDSTKSGSATIAVAGLNANQETIVSNTFTAQCGGEIDTWTISLDKATYSTGEIGTLTITAKDANGAMPASSSVLAGVAASSLGVATSVFIATPADTAVTTLGVKTYKFYVTNTPGSYTAIVDINAVTEYSAKYAAYKVVDTSGGVSNADVLKAIVSLIASINKQIAALQKALLKK